MRHIRPGHVFSGLKSFLVSDGWLRARTHQFLNLSGIGEVNTLNGCLILTGAHFIVVLIARVKLGSMPLALPTFNRRGGRTILAGAKGLLIRGIGIEQELRGFVLSILRIRLIRGEAGVVDIKTVCFKGDVLHFALAPCHGPVKHADLACEHMAV